MQSGTVDARSQIMKLNTQSSLFWDSRCNSVSATTQVHMNLMAENGR